MIRSLIFVFLALVFLQATLAAEEAEAKPESKLSERLEPFAPYIGKTFRGEFANSTKEKPVIDVQRWERALNGQAVRILHSVNDGQYGGETIIMWDAEHEKLAYWYFTTAGFRTHGSMEFADGKWTGLEKVSGEESGITEVKSVSEILSDGKLRTKAMFLKNGEWVDGHIITYEEDPKAEVIFK